MKNKLLIKGETVPLCKINKEPSILRLVIDWDIAEHKFGMFEIDAFAILLNEKDQVRNDLDFIFHDHSEDNTEMCVIQEWQNIKHNTKKESFLIKLKNFPIDIQKIAFCMNIYKGENRGQSFNSLKNLTCRLLHGEDELVKFTLEYTNENLVTINLCEIYKYKEIWKFRAVMQGFEGGIKKMEEFYNIAQ